MNIIAKFVFCISHIIKTIQMKKLLFSALVSVLSIATSCNNVQFAPDRSSDNGDGTFTNPVLWSDCPDPDLIRVGDD